MRMLEAAESGGYAVGAFNVYNLEGVAAVVGAAEALDSPAILQVRIGQPYGFRVLGFGFRVRFGCSSDLGRVCRSIQAV